MEKMKFPGTEPLKNTATGTDAKLDTTSLPEKQAEKEQIFGDFIEKESASLDLKEEAGPKTAKSKIASALFLGSTFLAGCVTGCCGYHAGGHSGGEGLYGQTISSQYSIHHEEIMEKQKEKRAEQRIIEQKKEKGIKLSEEEEKIFQKWQEEEAWLIKLNQQIKEELDRESKIKNHELFQELKKSAGEQIKNMPENADENR